MGSLPSADHLAPNLWVIDTVGSGSFRHPSVVDSLVWPLTNGLGLFVAALCFAIVGVTLARHGRTLAAVSVLVPLAVAMVYPATTGDVDDVVLYPGMVVVLGLPQFAFGSLAAADRDEDAVPCDRRLRGTPRPPPHPTAPSERAALHTRTSTHAPSPARIVPAWTW